MHRKVKHNRLREGGAEDHLAGGLEHRPAIEVSAATTVASPATVPAVDSSPAAKPTRAERAATLRAELRQLLEELDTADGIETP